MFIWSFPDFLKNKSNPPQIWGGVWRVTRSKPKMVRDVHGKFSNNWEPKILVLSTFTHAKCFLRRLNLFRKAKTVNFDTFRALKHPALKKTQFEIFTFFAFFCVFATIEKKTFLRKSMKMPELFFSSCPIFAKYAWKSLIFVSQIVLWWHLPKKIIWGRYLRYSQNKAQIPEKKNVSTKIRTTLEPLPNGCNGIPRKVLISKSIHW